jgi:multidrug efflux system membrane fusion protein
MSTEKTEKNESPAHGPAASLFNKWWLVLPIVCLLAAGFYFFPGDGKSNAAKEGSRKVMPPVPVVMVAARKGDMKVSLNGLGSVTALNTVTVKTRVDGQLMKVAFREGQLVRSGDLLAEIDPRPFQVQLTQAEGQMVKDRALLKNAQLDFERYRLLLQQDSISKQQLDTQEALVRQYEGAIRMDQGQIDSAKLQLTYCRITAPISGRVGLRLVDAGNIIHANDAGGLVVITQLQPISVLFSIPEDSLPSVLRKLRTGQRLAVDAYDRDFSRKIASGYLLTTDNQIDPASGTVKLKAEFPNRDSELFPNQFVNASLLIDVRRDATIVPASAVQRGPQGTFVYAVNADKTVSVRPVKVGVTEGSSMSIESGLRPGDRIVSDGAERLREGSKVVDVGQGSAPRLHGRN